MSERTKMYIGLKIRNGEKIKEIGEMISNEWSTVM